MKKILILVFLGLLSFSSIAQTFGEIGTIWKNESSYVSASGSPGQGNLFSTTIERYEYNHDSIIGLDTFQFFSLCKKSSWHTSGGLSGVDYWKDTLLVFQDSNKVFYGEVGSFDLAYDFNLVQGDSFLVSRTWNGLDTIYSHVKLVDSVSFNGVLRKRISFDTITAFNQGMVWIEGIGDYTFGLFQGFILEYGSYTNNCFIQDDSTIYGNCPSDYQCLEAYIPPIQNPYEDTPPEDTIFIGLKVYPNPFHDQIIINYEEPENYYTLRIYDMLGQKVHVELVYGYQHVLNIEELTVGAYVLKISEGAKQYAVKIVKVK